MIEVVQVPVYTYTLTELGEKKAESLFAGKCPDSGYCLHNCTLGECFRVHHELPAGRSRWTIDEIVDHDDPPTLDELRRRMHGDD